MRSSNDVGAGLSRRTGEGGSCMVIGGACREGKEDKALPEGGGWCIEGGERLFV